ncbi:MAG: GNAT family N-acetyltransferase [Treponema sp.]|nr:GNAT family N-acetyltransferase [Treponema sp.]
MRFDLSPALIDEILYVMEDQGGEFLLDTREGLVLNTANGGAPPTEDDERYIALPKWGPSDGFRLMGRFTAGLRNTPVRQELSGALDRGKGVFRAFKDTLARYSETERLWFAYKEGEMKRKVLVWYNALREAWGLELIGEEPEDIAGLALEDFRFREGTPEDAAQAGDLHRVCIEECRNVLDNTMETVADALGEWFFPGDLSFVAETAGGDFAGYVCAVRPCDSVLRICAVEVPGEYRGLGLGKSLVARVLEQADRQGIPQVAIDLPAGQEYFSRVLLREFFRPCVQRYVRNTQSGNNSPQPS